MLALDFAPSLADFLNDDEVGLPSDDAFDLGNFMRRLDDEVERIRRDPVVFVWVELDRVGTREPSAFAVEGQCRCDLVLVGSLIDLLVDPPEDLFVAGGTLGEVHGQILTSGRLCCIGLLGGIALPRPLKQAALSADVTAPAKPFAPVLT